MSHALAMGVAFAFPEGDDVVCLQTPSPSFGVGVWYADFAPTTDEEVVAILAR